MRLSQLEAHFVKLIIHPPGVPDENGQIWDNNWPQGRPSYRTVETLAEADGVFFLCPKCFEANGGAVGTHQVGCFFVGKVPDWIEPGPGRWNPAGTSIEDLTFVPPGAVSVNLDVPPKDHHAAVILGGCKWHGFVRNGDAS